MWALGPRLTRGLLPGDQPGNTRIPFTNGFRSRRKDGHSVGLPILLIDTKSSEDRLFH
jgi:hypothetical protein